MAIKFSQFNERTASTATMTLVGYDGNQNIRILADDLFANPYISGTENTLAMFGTGGTILADSMLSQNVDANLLSVDGGLTATSFSTFQSGLQSDGPAYFYGVTQLGDAAVDLIQVTGTLQLEGPIRDVNTDLGNTDQILVSDAGGNVTWTDLTAVSTGTAQKTSILVKNIDAGDGGVTLTKGTPVYIWGSLGASERLYIDAADASNAAKMPCVGLLDQDLSPNGEGTATVTGKLKNLITSPIDGATPTENDTLYVKPGGGLTLTKPTGVANLIQNVGQVGRVSTSSDGNIVVSAILRTNDVPNLTEGRLWAGSTGNTIESQVIFVNEAQNRFGVNTATPVTTLHVQGGVRITGGVDLFQQHDNAFAGTNAGNQGTITGASNAAFGKNALAAGTTANNNSVLGYNAFAVSPTGNRNVAIGSGAIGLTTGIGEGNVAVGYHSLQNGTGGYNVAIGMDAMSVGVGGSNNVAIGRNTLQNTTANQSIAIGQNALQSNTTGAYNIAIGVNALTSVTGGTGRFNNAIGYGAGSNITTGQDNILIGTNVQASSPTVDNEIVIGNNGTGIGDNSVVIGNASTVKTELKGNVGIGTTNPSRKLTVEAATNPVLIGTSTGKRMQWENPNYITGYAEDPTSAGTYRKTFDFDGDYLGGGYVGVYESRTARTGVSMHAASYTNASGHSTNQMKVYPPLTGNSTILLESKDLGSDASRFSGIQINDSRTPTGYPANRFRLNASFTDEATIPFYVNGDAKINGDLTMGTNSIFLGGTGAANEFNDYEEGTYNPEFYYFISPPSNLGTIGESDASYWLNASKYTKIGDTVIISINLQFGFGTTVYPSSGTIYLDNLPFTPINMLEVQGSWSSVNLDGTYSANLNGNLAGTSVYNTTKVGFTKSNSGSIGGSTHPDTFVYGDGTSQPLVQKLYGHIIYKTNS